METGIIEAKGVEHLKKVFIRNYLAFSVLRYYRLIVMLTKI